MKPATFLALIILGLCAWSCAKPSATPGQITGPTVDGIPNIELVDPARNVWRSGQPTTNGLVWLQAQKHVGNIVKLNLESEGPNWNSGLAFISDPVHGEGFSQSRITEWSGAGPNFTVFFLPISIAQQMDGSGLDFDIKHAVDCAGGSNCLIHCEHGQDRIGLAVACYRVRFMGWTKQEAEQDMLKHGFHPELIGLWNYWKNATPEFINSTHISK